MGEFEEHGRTWVKTVASEGFIKDKMFNCIPIPICCPQANTEIDLQHFNQSSEDSYKMLSKLKCPKNGFLKSITGLPKK